MFFQKPAIKIFLFGFIAFGFAACDQNNAANDGQTDEAETVAVQMKTLSLEELKTKAENGVPEAQYTLGIRYETGDGVPENYTEAVRWYRLAADQGYAEAQYDLAVSSYRDQNFAEAMRWWRLAAEQGHAFAQFNLGGLYSLGEGVDQDDAEAAKWLLLSADQGHAGAQINLGFMYRDGRGVPQNLITAYMWLSLAVVGEGDMASYNKNAISEGMTPEQIAEAEKLTREWLEDHR